MLWNKLIKSNFHSKNFGEDRSSSMNIDVTTPHLDQKLKQLVGGDFKILILISEDQRASSPID